MQKFILLTSALLAIAISLSAHDFYLLPNVFYISPGSRIVVAFNNGDSFPESEAAPSLARLKDAQLQSATTTVAIGNLKTQGKQVVGMVRLPEQRGSLILSARTAPNFIELPADKFGEYLKEEGLDNVIKWRSAHAETVKAGRERYSKFAKSLLLSGTPDEFYKHVIGFPIEIIPGADPSKLHAGSNLPVRVVVRGQPASGLQLEAAWSGAGKSKSKTTIIGRTDTEGRIRVPLTAAGKWRLHSLLMERCSEPAAADWESFWASLTFEVR